MPGLRKCDATCDDDLEVIAQSRQEKKVARLKKSRRLAQQNWRDWLRMAESTLAGVSQMVWQNRDEMDAQRTLFAKVVGSPHMAEREWRNAITWAGATILSLSAEQSMKALAIRASSNGECCKTHDLKLLWNELCMKDRRGIEKAAGQLHERTKGTRLAEGPLLTGIGQIEKVVDDHRSTFEHTRYYKETRRNNQQNNLIGNLELWKFALAALIYAKGLEAADRHLGR